MKSDTIAVHGGYETEPTTRAVAVPIYQTVAYEFESADHGAALFNLEVEGHRYSRISNPTTAVLERRIAELEGGVEALCTSTGQAALNYAILNLADMGTNIVSVPQLYGTTHTLFAHLLPSQGITVRFAESDTADAIEKLIDDNTRAIFCESIGNPAGNICDIEALAKVAKRRGIPLVVDNTVATPILLRPIDYGADIVVHSLTKFLGGHGTTLGGAIVDSGRFPWQAHAKRFPKFNEPDPSYHGLIYTVRFGNAAYIARCRSVFQRTTGAVLAPLSAFLSRMGAASPSSCARIRVSPGSTMPASPTIPITHWRRNISTAGLVRCSLSASSVGSKPARRFTTRSSCSSVWSTWAMPNRSPAIRPRPRTGRCRQRSRRKPACGRK
jgi:O-acetylhomoserine (thiol)-lyase